MTDSDNAGRPGLVADGDLFLALFESAPDAMFIIDESGRIVLANTVAHTMFKWPAGTLVGETVEALIPPALAPGHIRHRQTYAAAPQTRMMGVRSDLRAVRVDGSDFYVEVSLSPIEWKGRRWIISAVRDVSERKMAEQTAMQALREQAIRDPLTGLFNRRMLDNILRMELARADRSRTPVAAIMADIDHFKSVNDRFGHASGDRVLMKAASIIKQQMRGGDLACRYGGEEFALILPGCAAETARERAESIRESLSQAEFMVNGGLPWAVTLSLGGAIYPEQATTADALLKAADLALLKAKDGGRNRVVMAPT